MKSKKKAIIYGTGRRGRQVAEILKLDYEILGFVDDICKDKYIFVEGKKYSVLSQKSLLDLDFDKIFVACFEMQQTCDNLQKLGIDATKIDTSLGHFCVRVDFIRSLSMQFQKYGINGACAELGVFQGDFARFINKFFNTKLYLIDTFSGFDERDIRSEMSSKNRCAWFSDGEFANTSIELVSSKMPYLERVEFVKGYFPKSVEGRIPIDEKFAFVNLDMDLEAPISAGLDYFWSRLNWGGVILIDDYYHLRFKGVMEAVDKFAFDNGLVPIPIGDGKDVFFVKK